MTNTVQQQEYIANLRKLGDWLRANQGWLDDRRLFNMDFFRADLSEADFTPEELATTTGYELDELHAVINEEFECELGGLEFVPYTEQEGASPECGTVGCALGWSPEALGLTADDVEFETWSQISDTLYGLSFYTGPWSALFSTSWSEVAGTAGHAAARILHFAAYAKEYGYDEAKADFAAMYGRCRRTLQEVSETFLEVGTVAKLVV